MKEENEETEEKPVPAEKNAPAEKGDSASCKGAYVIKETAGGLSFVLKAGNHQVIGVSEVYSSRAALEKGMASVAKNAPVAEVEDQTAAEILAVKHPKFELYTDRAGEYRFRLKAKNGEIILASEGYTTKAACEKGIESVRRNAGAR